jgi:chemotaxis protein methyltransferase CheR
MPFSHESLPLTDREFIILRELIRDRLGLTYDESKRDMLADRLSRRAVDHGFEAFIDYYYLLKYGPGADEEWRRVLDELSVPETYFWREFDQVQALVSIIVPEYFAQPRPTPLRIWSAACASGEEPLSIAMALHEAGWLSRAPIEILGSDGSRANIERAQKGVFKDRSLRSLPASIRTKYFEERDGAWHLSPEIQTCVRWKSVNLLAPAEVAGCLPAEIVFCRNVFIYFAPEAIQATVRSFAAGMCPPAYLFVGAAESLLRLSTDFDLTEVGKAFAYRKTSAR